MGDYVSMSDSEFRRWDARWIQPLLAELGRIFSTSLLHTALDFANGMIAEDTNPEEEPIAVGVGRARLDLVSPGRWSPLHRADCVELRTTSWIPLCVCVFHTHASR